MSIDVAPEAPDSPDAVALVHELESHLASRYPDESRHGYSVERLLQRNVTFYVARVDGAPAGCGGIELVDGEYGELKRMYVRPDYRGLGLAKAILGRLAEHARAAGIHLLRLETGIHQVESIGLYEGFGFRRIPPFGPYSDDPVSICMETRID